MASRSGQWTFYQVLPFITAILLNFQSRGCCSSSGVVECEYHVSPMLPTSIHVEAEFNRSGNVSQDGSYMTCHPEYMQCMVLWTFDQANPNYTAVLFKGCWKGNGDCERVSCIAHDDINARYLNNSRFCCCSSARCNAEFSYVWVAKNYTTTGFNPFLGFSKSTKNNYVTVIIVASIGFLLLLLLTFFAVYVIRRILSGKRGGDHRHRLIKDTGALRYQQQSSNECGGDREHLLSSSSSSPPKLSIDADQIDLLEMISRGRFSIVWKSLYKPTGEYVAVKMYPPAYRHYFHNEHQIYTWTAEERENIVGYYGGTERSVVIDESSPSPPNPQCWIVTSYMARGTLQDFLKANTVDWEEMCKIGASVARGLAYLHGGGTKPPIVHRDVNSRNVLVKPDGTCALCDFGFAMALEEPKAGASDPTKDTPLTEVGTVRYFPPEILEGAVNLRDPATALKQVDVYALGLVVWEIVSRCAPIYRLTDHAVPEYQAPFAKEIDPHPTLEQMQLWVCKKKIRPLFPPAFYKFNIGALRILHVLIEDCWDTDSEARITASCAHERLVSLQSLASVFGGTRDGDGGVLTTTTKPLGSNAEFGSPYSRYLSYPELRRQLQFIGGDSSTVGTGATSGLGSMGMNSSDRGRSINSSIGYHTTGGAESPATLQPYQGRNPCMERNLHVDSSDDSSYAAGAGGNNNNTKKPDRVSESECRKLDPCSPDTFARFASPALIALASGDPGGQCQGQQLVVDNPAEPNASRMTAAERGSALALLLMKSEKNRKCVGPDNNLQQQARVEAPPPPPTLLKRNHQQPVADAVPAVELVTGAVVVVDGGGDSQSTSHDSGNCSTRTGGTSSTSGSPKLRPAAAEMGVHL